MTSFCSGGLMLLCHHLPDDEPTGSTPMSEPVASKYALTVCTRPRSHEAARASEFAGGLYRAKLANTVSRPLYDHVAPSRGWSRSPHPNVCILYFVPGEAMKPATLLA